MLTVGFVVADVYLFREWYLYRDTINDDYATRCLIGAVALLLFSIGGRKPVSWLVSSVKRKDDKPQIKYSTASDNLKRPDGSVIHIQYEGKKDGQPILFVHGWNATSAEWYYQRKRLADKYRLVLIDLAGLGKSVRPSNKDFSLLKMADDVQAVIDHANLKNVILYGHSIGGMIILTLCTKVARSTDNIRGLILEHTTYTNPTRTILFNKFFSAIQKPVLEPLCWIMIALSPVFWLSKWMSYLNGNLLLSTRFITFTGTQTPTQLDFISRLSAMAPPAVFARGVLGMFRYDVTNEIESLRIPTLILAANKDRLTLPRASYEMDSKIPDSVLQEVAPGGHQALVERHHEVNEAVLNFLSGLEKRNSGAATRPDVRKPEGRPQHR
jgi:pimeloyl-ACP methyl ester carboxylesterase